MNPRRLIPLLACLVAFDAAAGPPMEAELRAQARYALQATLRPAPPQSTDGRYTLQASARLGGTDDRRFQVKSTAASCPTALPDAVFADGYESP